MTPAWSWTSGPRSTTTWCRAPGEYLGGIIGPGIEISIEALTSRAARLTKVDIAEPRSLIGKSTEAAVQSGIVYGFASQVDGICGKLRAELGGERDDDRDRRAWRA